MFKNDFNGAGLTILCDRCSRIVSTFPHTVSWETVESKGKKSGNGRRLDFCDEKCRILFCRGRKYYQRKLANKAKNEQAEMQRLSGN